MFAGNQYNLIVEAEDGNGWKDVEMLEIILAPEETNYDSNHLLPKKSNCADNQRSILDCRRFEWRFTSHDKDSRW